jgi:hypothetical protein
MLKYLEESETKEFGFDDLNYSQESLRGIENCPTSARRIQSSLGFQIYSTFA